MSTALEMSLLAGARLWNGDRHHPMTRMNRERPLAFMRGRSTSDSICLCIQSNTISTACVVRFASITMQESASWIFQLAATIITTSRIFSLPSFVSSACFMLISIFSYAALRLSMFLSFSIRTSACSPGSTASAPLNFMRLQEEAYNVTKYTHSFSFISICC